MGISEINKEKTNYMRFFDRTDEIIFLREIRRISRDNAQFTVVTGRRRIGKTFLMWKAYKDVKLRLLCFLSDT